MLCPTRNLRSSSKKKRNSESLAPAWNTTSDLTSTFSPHFLIPGFQSRLTRTFLASNQTGLKVSPHVTGDTPYTAIGGSSDIKGNLEPHLFESIMLKSDKGCRWDARIPFHLFVKFSTAINSGIGVEVKKIIWRQGIQKGLKCIRSFPLSCIIPWKYIWIIIYFLFYHSSQIIISIVNAIIFLKMPSTAGE